MAEVENFDAPFSVELETALLGALLYDATRLVDARALVTAEDFYLLRHRYIFEAMIRLEDRNEALNLTSMAEELRAAGRLDDIGGTLYLAQLISSTTDVQAAEDFARRVAEYAYRRRLLIAGDEIKRMARKLDIDVAVLRDQADATVAGADKGTGDNAVVSLMVEFGRYLDEIEATQFLPATRSGLETGFTDYDDLLDGFQPGSLNLLAARPGMGKSAFLLCAALNVAKRGGKVYVWSGEMPRPQLRQRLMSIQSGIPGRVLQRGLRPGGMTPETWAAFVRESGVLGKLPIYLDDVEDMTPALLKARCQRVQRRYGGLDLIIVDYLGLMEAGFKKENRNNEVGYISRKLKQLAHIAPVLCASQLNRELEKRGDKRPILSDLRDSGSLEQDSDTVTFIYRDAVYNTATEFPNRADLIVAKNRHGPTGTVYLHFERSVTRFANTRTETIDLRNL